jgi:hypothetical protein
VFSVLSQVRHDSAIVEVEPLRFERGGYFYEWADWRLFQESISGSVLE